VGTCAQIPRHRRGMGGTSAGIHEVCRGGALQGRQRGGLQVAMGVFAGGVPNGNLSVSRVVRVAGAFMPRKRLPQVWQGGPWATAAPAQEPGHIVNYFGIFLVLSVCQKKGPRPLLQQPWLSPERPGESHDIDDRPAGTGGALGDDHDINLQTAALPAAQPGTYPEHKKMSAFMSLAPRWCREGCALMLAAAPRSSLYAEALLRRPRVS